MKVTVKGFVYHQKYSWDDEVRYVFFSSDEMGDVDRVLIGPYSFDLEIPDNFDPTPIKINNLRKEKQRIQAEAHVKAENIERQIQELLCIENKVCA